MKLIVLLSLFSASVFAQFPQYGREPFVLKVQKNATQFYIQDIKQTDFLVADKTLQLYPKENVAIEIEIKGDTIFSVTPVPVNANPEKTIEVEFCQESTKNAAKPSKVYIKNPFNERLSFTLMHFDVDESKWNSIPKTVKPNATSNETWRDVVSSVVLKDWKIEKKKPEN